MGGEIAATVAEKTTGIQIARVVRPDTYIPYDYSCQIEVLPSYRRTLEKCCELLEINIHWEKPVEEEAGSVTVKAIGSSPSDETITIASLLVSAGDTIAEGDLIASVEADKASMDISAPVGGTISDVLAAEGDVLRVGTPLVRIASDEAAQLKPLTKEDPGTPIMERRRTTVVAEAKEQVAQVKPVYISNITTVMASRHLTNDELLQGHGEWDSEAIRKRTGIENRYWIDGDENVQTLAVKAARDLMEKEGLKIADIDAIVCSTGTPADHDAVARLPGAACAQPGKGRGIAAGPRCECRLLRLSLCPSVGLRYPA